MSATPDDERCWQCGALAVPGCAHIQVLATPARLRAPGQGLAVKRGVRQDTVRVVVPRCAACQTRNLLSTVSVYASLAVGALAGLSVRPDGAGAAVGAGLGLGFGMGLAALATRYRRRRSGLPSLADYPVIVSLRKSGWSEPN